MLIYEKENKLNISFDNEVSEYPDLQISKEDGKTSVTVDGQPSGGGNVLLVEFTGNGYYRTSDKTMKEILDASKVGVVIAHNNKYGSDFSGPISVDCNGETINLYNPYYVDVLGCGSNQVFGSYTDDGTKWSIPD